MKQIKRGRGPSMMSGVRGIVVSVFGIFWTIGALRGGMSAAYWMSGVIFVCVTLGYAVYNFKNASGETRYTEYRVVDENEEAAAQDQNAETVGAKADACPHCGAKKDETDNYCRNCGKRF